MEMNPLLQGLRVVDLSRLLPAPFCTQLLAQLGADVIKVEEKGGEYGRGFADFFALTARGKRSVELDLKEEEGVRALKSLVATADVLVESFRPGVMDRLGCGYAAMREVNPRLVYASLTGYGHSGPYRDRAGHDINYLAYAGVLDQTGEAGGPPTLCNTQIADVAGGGLFCALSIVSAAMGAQKSGAGTFVDCAMLDGAMALSVANFATVRQGGKARPRGQDLLSGMLPNYRVYEAADGHIAVGALEPKFASAMLQKLERPDLMALLEANNLEALHTELTAVFKTRTRDAWEALLADADCCVCGIFSPEEALENPQVKARGFWHLDAAGKPAFGFPVAFSNAVTQRGEAPEPGQHTDEVLDETARWRVQGGQA